jgi:hypothetical protein
MRVAAFYVDVLYPNDIVEHLDTRLAVVKHDDWEVVTGKYEVGNALWMVDGLVVVDGPNDSAPLRTQQGPHPSVPALHHDHARGLVPCHHHAASHGWVGVG